MAPFPRLVVWTSPCVLPIYLFFAFVIQDMSEAQGSLHPMLESVAAFLLQFISGREAREFEDGLHS